MTGEANGPSVVGTVCGVAGVPLCGLAGPIGGGITTQFTGPQPGRVRLRATKAPAGLLTSPTRNLRVVARSMCTPADFDLPVAPAYAGYPGARPNCLGRANFANGLATGQYAAPVFEYIFPENTIAGDPIVPNNLWSLGFLINGEGGGLGCSAVTGRFWIDEISYAGDGSIATFAARFEQHCEHATAATFGSVAYHATVPVYAHEISAPSLAFPPVPAGTDGGTKTITVRNTSTAPLPMQGASLTGAGAADFAVVADGCSAGFLPVGDRCDVTVAYAPTADAGSSATLNVIDAVTSWGSGPSGSRSGDGENVLLVGGDANATPGAPDPATPSQPAVLVTTPPYEAPVTTIAGTPPPDPRPTVEPAAASDPLTAGTTAPTAPSTSVAAAPPAQVAFPAVLPPTSATPVPVGAGTAAASTVASTGALTGTDAGAFTVTSDPCSGSTLAIGGSCNVSVVYHPTAGKTTVDARLTVVDAFTSWGGTAPVGEDVVFTIGGIAPPTTPPTTPPGTTSPVGGPPLTTPAAGGEMHPLPPTRILDTRTGVGLSGGTPRPIGDHETITFPVAGRGGVPATGVSAVMVNVTASGAKQTGWLALFPSGTDWPGSSTLNFKAGDDAPNLAVSALGADG